MATAFHYTKDDVVAALGQAGVRRGDVVLVYASLGRLGYSERGKTMLDACLTVGDALREAVGEAGTLLVPTYTYSIGRREVFDIEKSPSTIGDFTEHMRTRPGAIRSSDPMLAVTGIGPQAAALFKDLPRTCFGAGCLYARLDEADAKICMIGLDLHWATYRHYVEAMAGVPFRFAKSFEGVIRENGVERTETWTYHAAPRIPQCGPDGAPLAALVREKELSKTVSVGRGAVTVVDCRKYYALASAEFARVPWTAAKGPALIVEEIVHLEDARVGARPVHLPVPGEANTASILETFAGVRRGLVSEGADAVVRAIATNGEWDVLSFPTGTPYGTGVVPEKWTCTEASVAREDGTVIFTTATNPSHSVPGSFSFDGLVDREALLPRLRTHASLVDAVPRIESRSRAHDWELACSRALKDMLVDSKYRVRIQTAFSFGTLKLAERVVGDASQPAIAVCAQFGVGESSEALTALGVLLEMAKASAARPPLGHCIRLIAVPEVGALELWRDHVAPHQSSTRLRGVLCLQTAFETGENEAGVIGGDNTSHNWLESLDQARREIAQSFVLRARASLTHRSTASDQGAPRDPDPACILTLPTFSPQKPASDSTSSLQSALATSADLVLRLLARIR